MTLPHLKLLLFTLVGLTGLLIGWGMATAVSPSGVILVLLLAGLWLLWLAQDGRRWPGAPDGLAALLALAAAWALWAARPDGLPAYAGLVGLLVTWDLSVLNGRLGQPNVHVADAPGLIRARIGRLLVLVLAASLALPLVGWLSIPFHFDRVLLLALALLFSLRYLAGRIGLETEE